MNQLWPAIHSNARACPRVLLYIEMEGGVVHPEPMRSASSVALALTSSTSSLTSDDKQSESSSPLVAKYLITSTSESPRVLNTAPL